MVQKVTQTIQVHGASFQMESDEPLSGKQARAIVDAFEKYPPNILNVLSKGRPGEPPLKLVVSDKNNWPRFSSNLIDYLIANIAQNIDVVAGYNTTHNMMLLQKRYLEEEVVDHELAHAIGDFAHTHFLNGGNSEAGDASDLFIDDRFFDDHPHLMNTLSNLYYGGMPLNSWSFWKPEVFACTLAAKFRGIRLVPGGKTLIDKIKKFLRNYPHIEGVDPREQFQTNDLPSELLESKPYK